MEANQMLSHYRLVEKIGEGGMGVVWRALDTTLDREVAIKILPEALEQHAERLDRFEREAKVLASLHHPNIAVLHGMDRAEGVRFLVMELVDGEDLSQRLARGPLATMDALKLCAQIARALQAAHDRGVVHRDLKPANIVLTASGEAKVLDFGLAKVLDPEAPDQSDETSAPTVTTGGTMVGTILGTAAYMSPEQARGKQTDRRTDIWSFGCVLHECLTGVSEFRGDTMSDSIGAILHKSPDWNALPDDLPPTVRWLLRRCLTKDRDSRLHDIADARIEIEQAIVDPQAGADFMASSDEPTRRPSPLMWGVVAVLAILAAGLGWWLKPSSAGDVHSVGLSLELPVPQDRMGFVLSPDGTTLVYDAEDAPGEAGENVVRRLWMRRLDSFLPTPIPGTEGAGWPAFSPDGRSILFVTDHENGGQHQGDVRVVDLDGRPPLTLATNASDHARVNWLNAEEILYIDHENEKRLLVIPRGGGDFRELAILPDTSRLSPFSIQVVRGGEWIATNAYKDAEESVLLIDPKTGEESTLIRDASEMRFLSDGRVLFVRSNTLLVAEVDYDTSPPKLGGSVQTVMGSGSNPEDLIRSLAVSESGHLAFVTGQGGNESVQLMTVDREGTVEPLIEGKGAFATPSSLSPDGSRLAVVMRNEDSPGNLWVVEMDTGARRPMARGEPITFNGVWLDNDRIAFTSWNSPQDGRVLVREMRRTADPVDLWDDWPDDLMLDGLYIAFDGTNLLFKIRSAETGGADIWLRPVDGSSPARPLLATPADEDNPSLSPDGRWLAYRSDESGRAEIYVRAYDPSGELDTPVVRVSRGGGMGPIWGRDSGELIFTDPNGSRLYSTGITGTDRPVLTPPSELISDTADLQVSKLFPFLPFVVAIPGDDRLIFAQTPVEQSKIERIEIVLNWAAQLER